MSYAKLGLAAAAGAAYLTSRGRRSRIPTGTIHTGRFNDLGDELVVFPGRSDWGEQGWFVGEQVNAQGREPFVTPKVFFRGAEGKDHAIDSARTEEFWGFPEGRSARGRRSTEPYAVNGSAGALPEVAVPPHISWETRRNTRERARFSTEVGSTKWCW